MAATGGAGSSKGRSGKRVLAETVGELSDEHTPSNVKQGRSSSSHNVMDGPPSKKKKNQEQKASKDNANADIVKKEWPDDDLSMLIDRLQMIMPKNDSIKFTTQMEKIDWDTVKFGIRTAHECKTKWAQIITKLRRYRTMTELVNDAKVWAKRPWTTFNNAKSKNKHPDLPKKPLTPYFRYFLEKRAKYSSEHPTMSMTELAKLLAKKFAELPEKKKQKYKDSYERENETYKIQMEKFKEEHPDMFNEDHRSGNQIGAGQAVISGGGGAHSGPKSGPKISGPPKPRTAMQLFLAEKMMKHTNLDPSDKKEYEDKYRQQWKTLSDSKRVKWIRKALSEEQKYTATLQQMCLENPEFKLEHIKSVISKAEKELMEKIDGKPEKPPNSGYSLYSKIMLKQLRDIPSKEKMGEISRRWKEMGEKDRQHYTKQALEATERYHKDYASYLASLPEDAIRRIEEEKNNRKKKGSTVVKVAPTPVPSKVSNDYKNNSNVKPKKPLSALFFYQQEKLAQYKANYPGKSEQELTRLIAREYGELSDKKKDKYKKMVENAKKQPLSPTPPARETASHKKTKLFKGEPKKPPQSGYLLYTTEIIAKLVDIEPKQRMVEISRRWKELSTSEQDRYKKRAADHMKKYNKEMTRFISNLNKEDQTLYHQMKANKRGGAGSKAAAAAPSKKIKVEVVSEEDESDKDNHEESSGESDSESDSSDDESDRSGSGSGSESKSDSDSSNSDSDNTKDGSSASSSDDSDSDGSGSDSDSGSDK